MPVVGREVDRPRRASGVDRSLAHADDESREHEDRHAVADEIERPAQRHHERADDEHDAAAAAVGEPPGDGSRDDRRERERAHDHADRDVTRVQGPAHECRQHRQRGADRDEREQRSREDARARYEPRMPPPELARRAGHRRLTITV